MKTNKSQSFSKVFKEYTPTIVTVMFGFQLLRVLLPSFVGYLRDSVGVGSLDLAPIALGIFALSFLAAFIARLVGVRRAYALSVGGVALIRIAEQLSSSPQSDLYLAAVGTALFLIFIPISVNLARGSSIFRLQEFAISFLLGLSLDSAIHIGARTVDLTWLPGILPATIIVSFAGISLYTLPAALSSLSNDTPPETTWKRSFSLLAFGPWMFLQVLVFQNVARIASLTGWETPLAGTLLVAANAVGIALAIYLQQKAYKPFSAAVIASLLLIATLLQPEPSGATAAVYMLLGITSSFLIFLVFIGRLGQVSDGHGLVRATVANGIGQIVFVLMTFLYYVSYDIKLGFPPQSIIPFAAFLLAIIACLAALGQSSQQDQILTSAPITIALSLIVIPLVLLLTWRPLTASSPDPSNKSVRIMSYNLHNGFNTDGRLDLEALAKVIEQSNADVVALQEISRGWLIWGSVDMLTWLSQRLGMPYVYGPTADAQWGNALLSRFPITASSTPSLPTEALLLQRGFIQADINIGGGIITVMGTHFAQDDSDEHQKARVLQSTALISAWGNSDATVILGDLNARPDEPPIQLLASSGLIDISSILGVPPTYTYYAAYPDHQIDYIWASPDLNFSDFSIIQTTASDHLPLIVTITLP